MERKPKFLNLKCVYLYLYRCKNQYYSNFPFVLPSFSVDWLSLGQNRLAKAKEKAEAKAAAKRQAEKEKAEEEEQGEEEPEEGDWNEQDWEDDEEQDEEW